MNQIDDSNEAYQDERRAYTQHAKGLYHPIMDSNQSPSTGVNGKR